jgi:hypothetical protein
MISTVHYKEINRMNKTLKWILGIVLVVVLGAGLFYAGTLIGQSQLVAGTGWAHPMMGGRGYDQGFERGLSPMMGGRGGFLPSRGGFSFAFLPLMFLGGLLRLLPLALGILLVYWIYQMGKRAGQRSVPVAAPVATPVSEDKPAE